MARKAAGAAPPPPPPGFTQDFATLSVSDKEEAPPNNNSSNDAGKAILSMVQGEKPAPKIQHHHRTKDTTTASSPLASFAPIFQLDLVDYDPSSPLIPNAPIRVSWTNVESPCIPPSLLENKVNPILQIGIYRSSQAFHESPIVSRTIHSNKIKKGSLLFRCPRSPGDYEFRAIIQFTFKNNNSEGVRSLGSSKTFSVRVNGKALDASFENVRSKLAGNKVSGACLQLSRILRQVSFFDQNERNFISLLIECRQAVLSAWEKDSHSALHTLFNTIEEVLVVWKVLPSNVREMIHEIQAMRCNLTGFYYTTEDSRVAMWKVILKFEPWTEIVFDIRRILYSRCFDKLSNVVINLARNNLIPNDAQFYPPRISLRKYLMTLLEDGDDSSLDLIVFGSSQNLFGTLSSDLDLCLVSAKEKDCDDDSSNPVDTLEALRLKISGEEEDTSTSSNPRLSVLEARLNARIPILMLEDSVTGLQVDICVSNPLAIRNTALLRAYALCDDRVRILAFWIKNWTKKRRMNSPSEGTLSSYGYILMLISYLQKLSPPVLPVLTSISPTWDGNPDNMYSSKTLPSVTVSGCETFFYDPMSNPNLLLPKLQNAVGRRNNASVGQLLMGFMHYYALEINVNRTFVSVRSNNLKDGCDVAKKVMAEERWRALPRYAIEDPFEVSYDVAHVLKDSRQSYIRQEFARAYKILHEATVNNDDISVLEKALDEVLMPATVVPFLKPDEIDGATEGTATAE